MQYKNQQIKIPKHNQMNKGRVPVELEPQSFSCKSNSTHICEVDCVVIRIDICESIRWQHSHPQSIRKWMHAASQIILIHIQFAAPFVGVLCSFHFSFSFFFFSLCDSPLGISHNTNSIIINHVRRWYLHIHSQFPFNILLLVVVAAVCSFHFFFLFLFFLLVLAVVLVLVGLRYHRQNNNNPCMMMPIPCITIHANPIQIIEMRWWKNMLDCCGGCCWWIECGLVLWIGGLVLSREPQGCMVSLGQLASTSKMW